MQINMQHLLLVFTVQSVPLLGMRRVECKFWKLKCSKVVYFEADCMLPEIACEAASSELVDSVEAVHFFALYSESSLICTLLIQTVMVQLRLTGISG